MNIIKLVSVALCSMCMLFLSCKKENPSLNETPATVEIFVCNSKGEPLANKTVGLYDENRYTDFQRDHTVKASVEVVTNQNGIANFILESQPWFVKGSSAELMFVVQKSLDAANYKWWSRGGTVTLGKKHSFKIEIDDTTDKLLIENGVLTGLADPSLTQVVLPAEVKIIASGAFRDSHIESLVLNEGLEAIEPQAFSGSQKLASVVFPASLKEIGEHAFEDCVALTEIDLSKTALQEISADAFRETGLKKVTLPASLKKIGSQAFLGTHLEEVVFSAELQEIDDEAFTGVAELTSVTLSNNIQRIGYRAFSDCEQLTKVAYVGEMKTADCMVEIGAFQNCTSLTSFTFPQSLSEVQGWTFVGCRKLKEITLPKSVKKVGDQALRTNSTVETITFEGEEAPELTGNPFPFKENILKIMVPSGKSEAYKAKWGSYEGYYSKIEEKS